MANVIDARVPDLSNHDESTLNVPEFVNFGIKRAIVGTHFNIGRSMVARLKRGGIDVFCYYVYLPFGDAAVCRARALNALEVCRDFGIKHIAWDCEDDWDELKVTHTVTPPERRAVLGDCIDLAERFGIPRKNQGIYTGSYWWVANMGNTNQFKDLWLWHADWGQNDGTRVPVEVVNYGGWSKVAIHQYTSLGNYAGRQERDLNYLFQHFYDHVGVSAPEADMTEAQVRAIAAEAVGAYRDFGVGADVLFLLEQMVGIEPNSYQGKNLERVAAVVAALEGHSHEGPTEKGEGLVVTVDGKKYRLRITAEPAE